MVAKGQFLERPTLVPVGPVVLEALSHRGDRMPPLLVLPPPPEEGGGMDHAVSTEIVWAVAMAGHPTLRFNFRGVGASQGRRGEADARLADAAAALQLIQDNTGQARVAVAALGGSGNTALELAQAHPELSGLCFISPLRLELGALDARMGPMLAVMGQRDLRERRALLSSALERVGGALELVPDADAAFNRNLPQVGQAVVRWLASLGG